MNDVNTCAFFGVWLLVFTCAAVGMQHVLCTVRCLGLQRELIVLRRFPLDGGMGYKNSSANAGKQFYLHVHPLSFTRKCLCNCVSSLFLQGEREWKIMHSDSPVLLISLQGKRFAEHNRWCNCRKTQAGAEKENIPQCLWELWLNKNHWTYSMSEFNSHKAVGGFSQQAS